ncbi:hypothetical protein ACHAXS_010492 [Conticribra weissflogii]
MPLTGSYSWFETINHIVVEVPLKAASRKKVDVFTAPLILKISYPPFLVDINLYAEIDEEKSKAVLEDGTLKVKLAKETPCLWGQIYFDGSKEEIILRRHQSFEKRKENVQRHVKKVAEMKVEEERMTFRKHMALEEKERQRIDNIKEAEKKRAEEEMHQAFSLLQSHCANRDMANEKIHGIPSVGFANLAPQENKEDGDNTQEFVVLNKSPIYAENDLMPPRKAIQSTFRHTPRLFKTPSRESTVKQEQEFIIKNRNSLRKNVLLNTGGRDIGDVDPIWLIKKGDEFLGRRDFSSAINAYSEAFEADDTMVKALGNRASCYLHLREAKSCINDCVEVLKHETLSKEQFASKEEEESFKKKILISLGIAYCLNGEHESALQQFKKALQFDSDKYFVKQCIDYTDNLMKAFKLKAQGDYHFAESEVEKAKECYTEALAVDPTFVQSKINRAACHLAMEKTGLCIEDCNAVLDFLSCEQNRKTLHHDNVHADGASIMASLLFPEPRTRRTWIATMLCRRAAAKKFLQDSSGALKDLLDAERIIRRSDVIDKHILATDIAMLKEELCIA